MCTASIIPHWYVLTPSEPTKKAASANNRVLPRAILNQLLVSAVTLGQEFRPRPSVDSVRDNHEVKNQNRRSVEIHFKRFFGNFPLPVPFLYHVIFLHGHVRGVSTRTASTRVVKRRGGGREIVSAKGSRGRASTILHPRLFVIEEVGKKGIVIPLRSSSREFWPLVRPARESRERRKKRLRRDPILY